MVHSSDRASDRGDHVETLLAEAKDRGRRRRTQRRHAALGGAGAMLLLGIVAAVFVSRSPAGTKLVVLGPSKPYPASPSIPQPTLPPTPGPSGTGTPGTNLPSTAVPATAPPCQAGDLQAQGSWQGAGGSMSGGISLVNGGTASCSVEGQPAVELFDQHGQALSVVASSPRPPASQVLLAPHSRRASALVQWSNWCGTDPGPVVARVSLPLSAPGGSPLPEVGSVTVSPPIRLIPRCNSAASPSTLDVGNLTPG